MTRLTARLGLVAVLFLTRSGGVMLPAQEMPAALPPQLPTSFSGPAVPGKGQALQLSPPQTALPASAASSASARAPAGEGEALCAALPPQTELFPIDLPTALRLAGARSLDIALATARWRAAAAEWQRTRVLWLPTIYLGTDYYRHDGQAQDVSGNLVTASRDGFMVGAGPSAVVALSEAWFAPLAARQTARARQAGIQAATHDVLLSVGEAYFAVQQARGELAGAQDTARRCQLLLQRTEKLAPELTPALEVFRVRAEWARQRQAIATAQEHWRSASAELARLLRLEPGVLVQPQEPPQWRLTWLEPPSRWEELLDLARRSRPELAAQQALVQAAQQRLQQERWRPWLPNLLLRGFSTPVVGTLAGGLFGGGPDGRLSHFAGRSDLDLQLVWEFQGLGLGNHARLAAQWAEYQAAQLELARLQDRIAAEVVQALAQVQSATSRLAEAEKALHAAHDLAERSFQGLGETRLVGNVLLLLVRPQEVVAALQTLAQAYRDYYSAVADYDRAQLRLYHALGQPAEWLLAPRRTPPLATLGTPIPQERDAGASK
jgi:outer membrane protein TolC